jgi:hypothetical protein
MYDIIGDIHGHADKLIILLNKLGYAISNGVFGHPSRKALFIGDYIDRGPKIRETLGIIRRMVDNDKAVALMGNHEYNAICFHYPEKAGGHLRKHLIKNILQHYETLRQFKDHQKAYEEYLDWFLTLPLYFETENFRAVHATWDHKRIRFLRNRLIGDRLTVGLIYESVIEENPLFDALEAILKGREIILPDGLTFRDKDGFIRHQMRIRWWEDPAAATYKSIGFLKGAIGLPDTPVESSVRNELDYYTEDEKPVFFGHYCLDETPALIRSNICCVDFCVAHAGSLAAYRYHDEKILVAENLVYV